MDNISLSASIAVRRIIDGDTLSIWFTTNGIPLHQGLNPNDFTATPKWTESGDHPVITPNVSSARKNAVSLLTHTWKYNSVEITFASGIGWVKSTNFDGKFKLNTKDGTLAIIGDLATKDNQDADVLEYTGMASVGSASYEMTNSIGVVVPLVSSSYKSLHDSTSVIFFQVFSTLTHHTILVRKALLRLESQDLSVVVTLICG